MQSALRSRFLNQRFLTSAKYSSISYFLNSISSHIKYDVINNRYTQKQLSNGRKQQEQEIFPQREQQQQQHSQETNNQNKTKKEDFKWYSDEACDFRSKI